MRHNVNSLKRTRSKISQQPADSPRLSDTGALGTFVLSNAQVTPPLSPEKLVAEEEIRPSKLQRSRSKIVSVLRALTNSASGISHVDITPPVSPVLPVSSMSLPPTTNTNGLVKKLSLSYLKGHLEPTVVHRTQFKSRPSIISQEGGIIETAEGGSSPSSAGGSSTNSGKSSGDPRPSQSTGKTSLESKLSTKSKGASQSSSENKKTGSPKQVGTEGGSVEGPLAPIAEVETPLPEPEPVPTFVTVERAAAAKIFFECHYNDLTSTHLTPRSLRRRDLETALHFETALSPSEKDDQRRAWARRESGHLRETRVMKARGINALKGKAHTSSMFEVVKILGKGSFGVVRLVREKPEEDALQSPLTRKDVFAMKVIRKSDMLRNSQEGHLRAERDFLVSAEGSRWVVPLITSFQDLNSLYLVMDYMPGGDFLGLLIRENTLPEPVTKFYIAEMILCIEEAHRLHWIHRDVKPDNFLISASGHLKISDFGLAFDGHWSHDQAYYNNHRYSLLTRLGINVEGDSIDKKDGRSIAAAMKLAQLLSGGKDRHELTSSNGGEREGILNWRNRKGNRTLARSVVGTSQYMAPEVVRGELYDARCDWWSVAVILYECLYGHTPFLAEEGGRQQTKLNIINHKTTFQFPFKTSVSKHCKELMRSMIQEKEYRLCSQRYLKSTVQPSPHGFQDYAGRYVYPEDAEDIRSHKWFRGIDWENIHLMDPPFVPNIKTKEDTHYFDEEDPISDFSDSVSDGKPDIEEIADALRPFNREIQILAYGFIERPHDSARLRKVDKEIDNFFMSEEQKDYLKAFVKHYGRKEKKRPRDRLLRDKEISAKVLELRKKGAFLGYTYRRIRLGKESTGRRANLAGMGVTGKRTVWHRSRLSIH